MTTDEERLALDTMQDNMRLILDQREKDGVMAIPEFLAALQLLPFEQQEKIGTLMRQSFIKILVEQNTCNRMKYEIDLAIPLWVTRIHRFLERLLSPKKPSYQQPANLPSFGEEVEALFQDIDINSPTQCFMISELFTGSGNMEKAKEWYQAGLSATRRLADDHPETPITIFE